MRQHLSISSLAVLACGVIIAIVWAHKQVQSLPSTACSIAENDMQYYNVIGQKET